MDQDALIAAYAAPGRHYHNLAHIQDCLTALANVDGLSEIEYETLSGEEITDVINGKKPNRESVLEPTGPRTSAVPPAGKPRPRPDPDPGLEPQPQA